MSKTYDTHENDGFSPEEQRALALWRAPEPPPDLAERALARAALVPEVGPARRGLAVAAAALVLVGGFFTMRTLARAPAPPYVETRGMVQADAGPGPEVRQAFDGIGLEPS